MHDSHILMHTVYHFLHISSKPRGTSGNQEWLLIGAESLRLTVLVMHDQFAGSKVLLMSQKPWSPWSE
jgi:hypothetical protein